MPSTIRQLLQEKAAEEPQAERTTKRTARTKRPPKRLQDAGDFAENAPALEQPATLATPAPARDAPTPAPKRKTDADATGKKKARLPPPDAPSPARGLVRTVISEKRDVSEQQLLDSLICATSKWVLAATLKAIDPLIEVRQPILSE